MMRKSSNMVRLGRSWPVAAVLAIVCVGSLMLGQQAMARPFSADFSVEGSNGYRISVSARQHAIRVLVTQGHAEIGKDVVETEYSGHASASPAGIEADLGILGSVSLQFHPTGKGRIITSPKNCSPYKVFRRPGTFTGSFRFLGEGSYTTVEATELQGSVGMPDDLLCITFLPPIEGHPPPAPYLAARTSNHYLADGFLAFGAETVEGDPHHVYFSAESRETVADLSVRRYVYEVAPISRFAVGRGLRKATVTPPAPFAGSASFERRPKGKPADWSGSLSVSFPGKSEVPLTGPSFKIVELGQHLFP